MLASMDYQLLARRSSDRFPRVVEHQLDGGGQDPSLMGTMLFDMFSSQLGNFSGISSCHGNPTSYTSAPTLHDRFTFSDIMHLPDCQSNNSNNSSSFTAHVSRSLQYGDIMEDGAFHAMQDLPVLGQQACPSMAGSFVSPDDFQDKLPASAGSVSPDESLDAGGYGGQHSVQTDFLCSANWSGQVTQCEGPASSPSHVRSPTSFCLDIGSVQDSFDGSSAAALPTPFPSSLREASDCPGSLPSPFQQLSSIICCPSTTRGLLPSSLSHDNAYLDLCQDDLPGSCVNDEIANNNQLSLQLDTEISNGSPSTDTDGHSDKAADDGLSPRSSVPTSAGVSQSNSGADHTPAASNTSGGSTLPKRKRSKSLKNTEDVESQRMTHIAVERNRRKQMNEHLNVLRSLMPGSYVHKGDQASIIGGAIEFVKELEHLLQCLQAQKRRRLFADNLSPKPAPGPSLLHPAGFPVYPRAQPDPKALFNDKFMEPLRETLAESKSAVADVEVKMMGSEALVKIMSARRPGQLVKAVAALEGLHLIISHTNITTIDHTVLYSFTVTMKKECRLNADELAEAVQQTFAAIHKVHLGAATHVL